MAATGYTPIQLYYSTTASAVPIAGNLANGELAINITDGKLYYKNNSGTVTLLAGATGAIAPITANGVVYVNSSGQATSGSAFIWTGGTAQLGFQNAAANGYAYIGNAGAGTNTDLAFYMGATEGMRLTSTGLGIGTSSPSTKLVAVQTLQGNNVDTGAELLMTTSTATNDRLNLNFSMNGVQARARAGIGAVALDSSGGYNCGLAFYTRNAGDGSGLATTDEKMRIDSAGNLGLGVTPSAAAGFTTFDLSNATSGARIRLLVGSTPYGIFYTNGTTDVRLQTAASVPLLLGTNYNEYLRIAPSGAFGLSGANYGTAGQVLTSNGSGAAPSWQAGGGGSSQWTTTGSDIYYNTGNVGVGTTAPAVSFEVNKSSGEALRVAATGANQSIYSRFIGGSPNTANMYVGVDSAAGGITGNGSSGFIWQVASSGLSFGTNNTERMRVSSSGAVSIGTTSASGSKLTTYSTANDNAVYFDRNTGATAPSTYPVVIQGGSGGANTASYAGLSIIGYNGAGNSSSMRVGVGIPATYVNHDTAFVSMYGGGLWQNGTYHWSTDGATTYQGGSYNGCEFYNHLSDNQQAFTFYSAKSNFSASVIYARCVATTTNSTFNLFFGTNGNGTGQFAVRDSGNCVNTNNSYGSISDIKLKQDIVDASTQWDDIKNLRIRKFRWKSEVVENPNAKPYLGLIAQEAELVSPGLIEETKDYEEFEEDSIGDDGNVALKEDGTPHKKRICRELGTTTKTVKYSILYMKAIKALQEAMDRIEQLESKVSALESKGV